MTLIASDLASAVAAPPRRIVTGETAQGRSTIVSAHTLAAATPGAGLFEIWDERLAAPLDPQALDDPLATEQLRLSPNPQCMKARWFTVEPLPGEIPPEKLRRAAQRRFRELDAEGSLTNQDRHPFMHRTDSLGIVVLLSGSASLLLDDQQTPLAPGDVVVQRATSHAWIAHGGPAWFVAVLIGRSVQRK
jgi:hypothetical protein